MTSAAPGSARGSATIPVSVVPRDATPRRSRGLKNRMASSMQQKSRGDEPRGSLGLFAATFGSVLVVFFFVGEFVFLFVVFVLELVVFFVLVLFFFIVLVVDFFPLVFL